MELWCNILHVSNLGSCMSQGNIETPVFSGAFCQALEKEASSQLVISEQARCSQYYFGQSVETCGFFPKGGSFGCLLVQKFTKTSRIYHGWVCYIYIYIYLFIYLFIYLQFIFISGFDWEWLGTAEVQTRNFSIGFF